MTFRNILSNAWNIYSKRTCLIILLCEVVALISLLCIGFVYVHVYIPNYNAKRFPLVPVVCSTISDKLVENCELPDTGAESYIDSAKIDIGHPESISRFLPNQSKSLIKNFQWSSCGEFCSQDSAENKGCRQVRVDVRSPGSELRLVDCVNVDVVECGFRISQLYDYDQHDNNSCTYNNDQPQQCPPLDGFFTCKTTTITTPQQEENSSPLLECIKITTSWSCALSMPNANINSQGSSNSVQNCNTQSHESQSSKIENCLRKPGLHYCDSGRCILITNVKEMCTNTNKCEDIPLQGKNVVITHENEGTIITARCYKGFETRHNIEVYPRWFRNTLNPKIPPMLLINCNHIRLPQPTISSDHHHQQQINEGVISLRDCVNGTVLDNTTLPVNISLKDLESIWHEALTHEDSLLDPINQKHAPPASNLELFTNVRIYNSDFYKKNGCDSNPLGLDGSDNTKCGDFYENYARLPGHFRGQSLFPCYCRNTAKVTPYCIIGDKDIFMRNWDDILVQDWLVPYKILVLTFLSIILGLSFVILCVLLYPLITDSIDLNQSEEDFAVLASRKNSTCPEVGVELSHKSFETRSRRSSVFLTPVTPF